jgi:hypothetical protein
MRDIVIDDEYANALILSLLLLLDEIVNLLLYAILLRGLHFLE